MKATGDEVMKLEKLLNIDKLVNRCRTATSCPGAPQTAPAYLQLFQPMHLREQVVLGVVHLPGPYRGF